MSILNCFILYIKCVKCVASANMDAEIIETAESEIADLKMQLMTLEDDVCLME